MKKYIKIALLVLIGILFLGTFVFLWKKSQPKEIFYEIELVKQDAITKSTVVTGSIDPRDEVEIKPQITGIVTEIKKEPGDLVTEGEVLAVVKVVPDVASLNSAETQVSLSKMSLENAEKSYQRQKQLYDSKVISQQEFEESTLSYKKAKEEYVNAKDALEIIKSGISSRYAAYSNTQVKSTTTGTILDIPIKVGNSVVQTNNFNDGTTIATIANMKDMIFVGTIDEIEVGKLKLGMPMVLTVGAIENQTFDAALEYVSPKGTSNSGAIVFEIKARMVIPDSVVIRSGYSANAKIILNERNNVLTIPEKCVEFDNEKAYVYVLTKETPKQEFERKEIKYGISDGINIEVLGGLKLGEKIRGSQTEMQTKVRTMGPPMH